MPPYDIFFFSAFFFLMGVFLASIGAGFWILTIVFLVAAIFLLWWFFHKNKRFLWLTGLLFFVIVGALYYTWDDERFRQNADIPFDEQVSFSGLVVSNPMVKSSSQEFKFKLYSPFKGNILVKTGLYPGVRYGNELSVQGVIKRPFSTGYARYLEKERVNGTLSFAKIKITDSGKGSVIKGRLFGIRNSIMASFGKVLPREEAAFLGGLTLGGRSEFSQEFEEAMSLSGTTHLVALSGYNITIIVWAAMGMLVYIFSRRLSFLLTFLIIAGFVVMTGAEASVVRAAIMGILVLLAYDTGRLYSFRNAIILAGFLMIMQNPKVLVFDIGFQLSFLALLGIIYLKPALRKFLRIKGDYGFLSWRDNLLTTASAQLMVAPLLIINFNSFSITSLVANVLVLELIPVTMGLGFIIAAVSLLSYYASLVLGWAVLILLRFEILVIELFAKLSIPFGPSLGIGMVFLYYLFVIGFIMYIRRARVSYA